MQHMALSFFARLFWTPDLHLCFMMTTMMIIVSLLESQFGVTLQMMRVMQKLKSHLFSSVKALNETKRT